MKVFGLTGGIGMGKTTVERILRERGLPVVDTDILARQIVEPGQPALEEIKRAFGSEMVNPSGHLRRDELAEVVFANPEARQKLETITHPRIKELWREQMEVWRGANTPFGVVVIPLLFETSVEEEFDATVCVACSAATQWQRLQDRGWTSEQTAQRIAAQWPIGKKISKADYVIWSEGSLEVLAGQINRILPPA